MATRFPLVLTLFLAELVVSLGHPPVPDSTESLLARAGELIDAERYLEAEQVLREALRREPRAVEGHFLLGMVLARQEKWPASRESLERVLTLDPQHGRAHTELAGIEFKLGNRREAIRNLRLAEQLESDIEYVRTFLATLLYLDNRKTEALYYWNGVGAPRVDHILYSTPDSVTPELLQKLFPLNEGEVFRREQVLDIRWKQERFRLGSPFSWVITPRAADSSELTIALASGSSVASPGMVLLENAVRTPLYRELRVEYPMTLHGGRRIAGSFRWDEPRKRVQVSAWFPFVSSSSDGLGLGFDLRDEHWRDRQSGTELLLEARKIQAGYEYLFEGRKSLALRGGYENQKLSLPGASPGDSHFAIFGTGWNQVVGLNPSDDLQLRIAADLDGFFGYGAEDRRSVRGRAAVELGWVFERRSRSECRLAFGGGYASPAVPLDHYFILGIGQDDPLPLRAHPAVDRGRKGNSPMGRQYVLANLELRRRVLSWRFLEIRGLLFSDTASVDGALFFDAGRQWFQDVGFGLSLGVFGQERIEVLSGFDLKDSRFNLWVGIPLVPL